MKTIDQERASLPQVAPLRSEVGSPGTTTVSTSTVALDPTLRTGMTEVQRWKPYGWHRLLVSLGRWPAVLAVTLFSVFCSLLLTSTLAASFGIGGQDYLVANLISTIIPLIVTPLCVSRAIGLTFELEKTKQQLHYLATRDPLTEAYNRHYLMERLGEETAQALYGETPLSAMMIDADDFKSINDAYGHAAGDRVLVEIARAIRSQLSPTDLFARYGGEEFVILLPKTSEAEAYRLAEKIRQTIAALAIITPAGAALSVTVSIGIGGLSANSAELLSRADVALYEAKRAGRNRCVLLLQS